VSLIRIAANEKHYLSAIMQIRDPRHKRRLIIKAADVVLFGPPQRSSCLSLFIVSGTFIVLLGTHNLVKDMILISALFISIGACLYAFVRHRKTQESVKRMVKDLETLQQAERDLVAVTGK
jgi:Flp pilus assembly protein TadB